MKKNHTMYNKLLKISLASSRQHSQSCIHDPNLHSSWQSRQRREYEISKNNEALASRLTSAKSQISPKSQ